MGGVKPTPLNNRGRPRALAPIRQFPSSDRIELRVPDERDVDLIVDASTDELIPLITSVEPHCSNSQAREFIVRQQGRPAEGQGWSLTLVDRERNNAVGNLFISCRSLQLGAIELGYWIAPSHRGHGHAAEALALVRDWAPAEFGVDRLTLYIDPENAPSLRTAERTGFQMETTYDQWERVDDEFRPMTVWSYGAGRPEPTHIGRLEYRMWLDDYRGDPRWFDHHLHGDFVEHGCSGKLWTLDEITATPLSGIEVELPFADQQLRQLAADTWMLTYVAHQPDRTCRRMSIWQETPKGWRMRFHQGTPIPS